MISGKTWVWFEVADIEQIYPDDYGDGETLVTVFRGGKYTGAWVPREKLAPFLFPTQPKRAYTGPYGMPDDVERDHGSEGDEP